MSTAGRRLRLREATSAAHASLDARASTLDLEQLEDYRRFLIGNAAAVLAAESVLERAAVTDCFADWPQRSRRKLILEDLHGLGSSTRALRWKRPIPSRAEIFGIVYVLEGSRLGARMLLPRAQASGSPVVRANCRFLSAQQPMLWRVFLERLESADDAADEQAVVAGAQDAFALFERSFSLALAHQPTP
ncbi:MAG: biliverdin-producing heme oxygenase [Steroidobacteraceae bacterium]